MRFANQVKVYVLDSCITVEKSRSVAAGKREEGREEENCFFSRLYY